MPMLPADEYTGNERLRSLGLDAYPSSFGDVIGATAEDAWTRNPTPSILRELARAKRESGGYFEDMARQYAPDAAEQAQPNRVAPLTTEQANEKYGIAGHLKFDRDTPEETARDLYDLKREELRRKNVMSRSAGGFGQVAAQFATGLGASVLDPLNIASAFIPVVGQARYALWAERFGTTAARAARGAVEGFAGAAALEPVVYAVAQSEQADYSMVDSMLNLAFGTVLGGGLHVGLGRIGDMIAERGAAEPALRSSIAAVVEDRPVQVDQIIAYHGSPHSFDAFDMSRVGTGEGAQAYGHGLYFAEREAVARNYRDALSKTYEPASDITREWVKRAGGDWEKALKLADEYNAADKSWPTSEIRHQLVQGEPGRLYKVAINADREALLDWDKPLTQQSAAVQKYAREYLSLFFKSDAEAASEVLGNSGRLGGYPSGDPLSAVRGSDFYKYLAKTSGGPEAASKMLAQDGIPGLKYFDQGSRGAGDGTRNYVLFDDKLVSILPERDPSSAARAAQEAAQPAMRADDKAKVAAVDALAAREPAKAAPKAEGAEPLGPKAAEAQAELDSVMQQIEAATKQGDELPADIRAADEMTQRAESDAKAIEQAAFCLGRKT